jgi:predicted transcriptional regulator
MTYTAEEEKFYAARTFIGPLPTPKPKDDRPHPLAGNKPGVRATSRQALKSIEHELSDKQQEVLATLQMARRPINDREIAKYLGWTINSVTARRNELVELGKVIEYKRATDPQTKRRVIYWTVPGKEVA